MAKATCSGCGKLVYRSPTSRPEITCHECRRKQPGPYGVRSGNVDVYRDSSGKLRIDAICEGCGAPFKSRRNGQSSTGWTRHCTLACANRVKNNKRWSQLTPEQRRAREKTRALARDRKRRQWLGAVAWDGIPDADILERDRWICRLETCIYGSRRIYKARTYPDPRSPSVDHIMPLSLGGDDTQYNKRAAHLGCNMARGNQLDDLMPLPFGADMDIVPRFQPRQPRTCATCNEPLAKGKRKCDLHMPVYYFTCPACRCLSAHKKQDRIYCSTQCSASAHHDRMIQTQPAHLRGLQAKAMRDSGMSLDEIADRLGYSGAPYAAAAIARASGQRSSRRTRPYIRQQRIAS